MINPHNKQEITITMLNVELIQNNIIIDIIIVRKSTIKLVKIIHNENNGKEYGENSALFIEEISENVAVLRYKDFQLTDAATGLKVRMKSSNIDEAKVDAENYLKELWGRVERSYKRNLGALK